LLLLYAEALARVNHPLDAVKVLEGVRDREPDSVPVNLALGRVYLKIGEIEKGNAAINRCVSAHLSENRFEQAESLLREMAALAPEDDKIFQRLLDVARKRGEKGAIAQAYLDLAAVYEKKKIARSAAEAIEKYLEINPGDAEARRRLERMQEPLPAPKAEAPIPSPAVFRPSAPPPPQPPSPPKPPPPEDDADFEIELEDDDELVVAADTGINLDEEIDLAPSAEPDVEVSGFSDFLAALNKDAQAQPVAEAIASQPSQVEAGLTEIFQEFQRSVGEQVGEEDHETHYNLGIAYKEMGLLNEAITQFALAEKSQLRGLDALSMIALCLSELGRIDEAALKLRTGISLAVEGSENQKGLLYDLAALHEKAGRQTEARETLLLLLAIDPGYRDAAARVDAAPPAASAHPRKKSKVSYL